MSIVARPDTTGPRTALLIAVPLIILCSAAVGGVAGTGAGAGTGDVLVVDEDGGEYTSIQAAVDAASPGDVVRVRPGTYRETVVVGKNVTLRAPDGATLVGTNAARGADAIRIPIDRDSPPAPTISGFTIVDYPEAGVVVASDGPATISGVTVRGSEIGVYATDADGAWRLEDVRIEDVRFGIDADGASGDWTVADSLVRRVESFGIAAGDGDWTIANTTVRSIGGVGVGAGETAGDWRILNSTVASAGTDEEFVLPGISAERASGAWTVRGTVLVNNDGADIDAEGAALEGDATGNWWGQNGVTEGDCTGNVDCSAPLSRPPTALSLALRPTDATVAVNGTTTLTLRVDGVTAGVGSLDVAVNSTAPGTAAVVDASATVGGRADVDVPPDGSAAVISSIDGATANGTVAIATVTVRGIAAGTASLRVDGDRLTVADEADEPYPIADRRGATVTVTPGPPPVDVDGDGRPATDPDGDRLLEDVTGDGTFNILDVSAFLRGFDGPAVGDNRRYFDFNGDGGISILDVSALLGAL